MSSKYRRGQFDFILAIDTETSGYNKENGNYAVSKDGTKEYQVVSAGISIASRKTLKPIENLYVEIKFNDRFQWDMGAEKVHGLSREYLEKNGIEESEAVVKIAELILKYWGPTKQINFCGCNVGFDICFLQRMFERHGIELNISGRHIDVTTLGLVLYDTFNSDELFEAVGLPPREKHDSMEDCLYALKTAQISKKLFQTITTGE